MQVLGPNSLLAPISHAIQKTWETIKANGDAIKIGSAAVALLLLGIRGFRQLVSATRGYFVRRALGLRLGSESYTTDEIFRATGYYVIPDCQNVDPSGGEDWRLSVPVRQNAFGAIDRFLAARSDQKYSLVLADSGMGKTSLLLNYFARHWKSGKRRSRFNLHLIPLGQPNVEKQIEAVDNKENTVLFLDALDEDTKAIENHRARLSDLLRATAEFRHVLITCRTQFFPKDEEIPAETGLLKVGPVAAGESKGHCFYKLYLSPFSDEQVDNFIRKRFKVWALTERRKARRIAARIKDLTVRPMILAHIPDLLESDANFTYSFQIYEEMVSAWLRREEPLAKDTTALRDFLELLAVDMFTNRQKRGTERVSPAELDELLAQFQTRTSTTTESVRHSIERWQLRGRSLLNRDASGNWKFAHRSLMEYLTAKSILAQRLEIPTILLTDQTRIFLEEIYAERSQSDRTLPPLDLVPLIRLRAQPKIFTNVNAVRDEREELLRGSGLEAWPVSIEVNVIHSDHEIRHSGVRGRVVAVEPVLFRSAHYSGELHPTLFEMIITDFVAGIRWLIYRPESIYPDPYKQPTAAGVLRQPTAAEALSLDTILVARLDILARALGPGADLLVVSTSDTVYQEKGTQDEGGEFHDKQPIAVQYEFLGRKMGAMSVLRASEAASEIENPQVLRALVEARPTLSRLFLFRLPESPAAIPYGGRA